MVVFTNIPTQTHHVVRSAQKAEASLRPLPVVTRPVPSRLTSTTASTSGHSVSPFLTGTRWLVQRAAGSVFKSRGTKHITVCRRAAPDLPPGTQLNDDYGVILTAPSKGRKCGVILHPTSLPGGHGIGDIGPEAYKFVDWLCSSGMQLWQILPLVPPDKYWSPYSGKDANCGNPLLISLELLVKDGLVDPEDLPVLDGADGHCKFPEAQVAKMPPLIKAAHRILEDPEFKDLWMECDAWRHHPYIKAWLWDAAVFDVMSENIPECLDKVWWEWPKEYKDRDLATIEEVKKKYSKEIETFMVLQFLFDRQWKDLKKYANERDIKVVGDMPIYVGGHSADVWAHRDLFMLCPDGRPTQVSGVPPDAFSATGQKWGTPLYRWPAHQTNKYAWWEQRVGRAADLFDETRIDHFRAFSGYWSVPADAVTAMEGNWMNGPGVELFEMLYSRLGRFKIIAEDLGLITPDVTELRESIDAPGMIILQFAWDGGATNVHLPHNHYVNSVCYPGTHDNETIVGWYNNPNTSQEAKQNVKDYLGVGDGSQIAWDMIRVAMRSVSRTSIFNMQDVLSLDNTARMNTPGLAHGNWTWRLKSVCGEDSESIWEHLKPMGQRLYSMMKTFDRLPEREKLRLEAEWRAKKLEEERANLPVPQGPAREGELQLQPILSHATSEAAAAAEEASTSTPSLQGQAKVPVPTEGEVKHYDGTFSDLGAEYGLSPSTILHTEEGKVPAIASAWPRKDA